MEWFLQFLGGGSVVSTGLVVAWAPNMIRLDAPSGHYVPNPVRLPRQGSIILTAVDSAAGDALVSHLLVACRQVPTFQDLKHK
jgi:hypothetical protein